MSERDEFEAWVKSQAPQMRMLTLWDAWQAASATGKPSAAQIGWKLVPIDPTPEMVEAGHWEDGAATARAVWAEMIDAAPQPSPEPEKAAHQKYQD